MGQVKARFQGTIGAAQSNLDSFHVVALDVLK